MADAILTRKGGGNPIGSHLIVRKSHDGSEAPVTSPIELEYYQRIIADTQFSTALLEKVGTGEVTTTKAIVDGETLQLTFAGKLTGETQYKVTIPLNCVKDKLGNSLKGIYSYTFTTMPYTPPSYLVTTSASITDINTAIANIDAGSTIYFTDGTFLISSPLLINRSDIKLQGVPNKTVIKNNDTLGTVGLVQIKGTSDTPISNIVFDGFIVDGNTTASKTCIGVEVSYCGVGFVNTGTAYDATKVGTSYVNKTGVTISNCVVELCSDRCISIILSYNSRIINNCLQNSNSQGVVVGSSYNIIILDNTSQNNGNIGVYISSSHNCTVSGNTVQNSQTTGIYLENASKNTVTSNTVQNNSGNGVHLNNSSNNSLVGNTFQNNQASGVHLYNLSNNNTVTGNTVQNNSSTGIYVWQSSNNNTVSGNTIQSNGSFGISIYNSSLYNIFSGNISANNTTYDIYIEPTACYNTFTSNQTVLTICNASTTGTVVANNYDS
jgi:parallel beta-helix repeat protein